jgi:dipeptidase E
MRLYLSSFRIGNAHGELLRLMGSGRRTALILNADDYKLLPERKESLERELHELRGVGLEPEEVDLRRYFGRQADLQDTLSTFDALYVRGGNVFVLRRALRQSGADELIPALLTDDAIVYAGYSAGPAMLGPTLRGIEGYEDDPHVVPEGYNAAAIWMGLGVLPYMVLPHYDPERSGIVEKVCFYIEHHIPFIAIRDGEALVIDGDNIRVAG